MSLQEDPEWTAEKELCMRKGLPYVAPKNKVVAQAMPALLSHSHSTTTVTCHRSACTRSALESSRCLLDAAQIHALQRHLEAEQPVWCLNVR